MPVGAIAAVGGALIQGSAAKKAARSQERMAQQDIAFQKETRDLIRNDLSQYRTGGNTAQQALDFELGLADRPMIGGTPMAIETVMPGGQFSGPPGTGGQTIGQFPGGMTGGQTVGQFGGGQPAAAQPAMSAGQRASRWMDSFGRADRDGTGAANGGSMAGSIDSRPPQPTAGGTGAAGAGPMFRVGGKTFGTMEEAQAYANSNATGGRAYGGFTKTPGYDFRMQTGMDALQSSAAARGGLYSGAAMRDALKFGQDYGSNEYGNYLARLGARADTGLNAATMSGNASQQAAAGVSNALGNIGNAQAAGAIGMGNAFTGGIQNALGAWNYQRNLNAGMGGNTVGMFGGGR